VEGAGAQAGPPRVAMPPLTGSTQSTPRLSVPAWSRGLRYCLCGRAMATQPPARLRHVRDNDTAGRPLLYTLDRTGRWPLARLSPGARHLASLSCANFNLPTLLKPALRKRAEVPCFLGCSLGVR